MMERMMIILFEDPFGMFRLGLSRLLMAILGLASMISLAIAIVHGLEGDREGFQRFIKWFAGSVVGFIIVCIIGNL